MKKWFVAALIALGPMLVAQQLVGQQPAPEIPFDGNVNFLKLPPDMNFGEVSGVAVNSKGDIAVYHRSNSANGPAYGATASQVLLFDKTGKFVREIGKGLYAWSYAHEIKVDIAQAPVPPDAKPWMGATPNYQQALSAEAPPGSGTMAPGSPWAVCISGGPTQYIYLSDAFPGRIYKLSLDGKLLGYFGKSGHGAKQFGWIHEIACPSENELYVAELLNWRVQKLTLRPAGAKPSTAGGR